MNRPIDLPITMLEDDSGLVCGEVSPGAPMEHDLRQAALLAAKEAIAAAFNVCGAAMETTGKVAQWLHGCVSLEQAGHDSPPKPSSRWDHELLQASAELQRLHDESLPLAAQLSAALSAIEAVQEKGEKGNLVHLAAPIEAIGSMLNECMDRAVANGANSVSMPDEYVAVAAWLAGFPQEQGAVPMPKSRDVGRREEMSPDGWLRVLFDGDSDLIVAVYEPEVGISASVEFCTCGMGGGRSPRTREALIALMVAMEADNAESPSRAWPPVADPGQAQMGETK